MSRLKDRYQKEIMPALQKEFGYGNVMAVPKLEKIVVNIGLGRAGRMYEFFDRLINIALPRVRDFRGLSTRSFDGRGNYTLGLRDQLVFPEIDYSKVGKIKGMNVCMVTSAKTDDEARSLLGLLGLPFRR